jgi:hypothetical protein
MILIGIKQNADVRNDIHLSDFVVMFYMYEWECIKDIFNISDDYIIQDETGVDIFQFWYPNMEGGISSSCDYQSATSILQTSLWDIISSNDPKTICITIEGYSTDKHKIDPSSYILEDNLIYKSDCHASDFLYVDGFQTLPEIFDMVQRM